jgi:hypothetical protein
MASASFLAASRERRATDGFRQIGDATFGFSFLTVPTTANRQSTAGGTSFRIRNDFHKPAAVSFELGRANT